MDDADGGGVSRFEALERENASKKDEIQKLRKEIESLRSDGEAVAARAAELESEMSAVEEARSEAETLRKFLEEKESTVWFLEREAKSVKQANAESEMKVRDLERRLGVVEVRESEERGKRVRVEEEMREKVGEKESEIEMLKQRIEDLEKVGVVGLREEGERVNGEGKNGLGFVWPVAAAGCGVVVAVFYFCFRKRR